MDATDVLAVHDERCGGPPLWSQWDLAGKSPQRSAWAIAPSQRRCRLRQNSVGRGDESARLAASCSRQKTFRTVSLAEFPTASGVGCVLGQVFIEPGGLSVDLVSGRQSGPKRAGGKAVFPPHVCVARGQNDQERPTLPLGR